jgi:predicted small lipoprotein YifL
MNQMRAMVALLALFILAACGPGPDVGPTATGSPQASPEPAEETATASPEATAAPAQATVTPSPTRGSRTYLFYESEANGYSIRYPEDWQVSESPSRPGTTTFTAPLQGESDTFRENVTVVVQSVPAGTTSLDEFTEMALAQGQDYIPQFTVRELMPTTLGGNPAQQVVYTGVQGTRDLRWLQLWTLAGDQVYILTYTAEEFEFNRFRSAVQQMIRSMEIR